MPITFRWAGIPQLHTTINSWSLYGFQHSQDTPIQKSYAEAAGPKGKSQIKAQQAPSPSHPTQQPSPPLRKRADPQSEPKTTPQAHPQPYPPPLGEEEEPEDTPFLIIQLAQQAEDKKAMKSEEVSTSPL
eukprot:scaffold198057_cov35-Tisochrysis_lutea.AAC.1